MKDEAFPIPVQLNVLITSVLVVLLPTLLVLAKNANWLGLILLSILYGIFMNTGYALLHEAEHGMLHPNAKKNHFMGAVLALFFPAPFDLIRQGHIGHHMRNRSDDEAFDFYFEGENVLWKKMQLYGILTGLFWLVILLSNVVVLVFPWYLKPRKFSFDRPTEALLESLNQRFLPIVWLESVAIILLHGTLIFAVGVPWLHWFIVMSGFGFMWSAMQYVHHFGTDRDVMKGALNLKTFAWLDALWLNHNWHLRHHELPTVPWIYLPYLDGGKSECRQSLWLRYLKMWRGPRLTLEHVENQYAGKIIR